MLSQLLETCCRTVAPPDVDVALELCASVDGDRAALRLGEAPSQPHDCGCLQDMLLAVSVAQLAERGTLDAAQTIGTYLPELLSGHQQGATIRIGDLLCHSSGVWPPAPNHSAYGSWSKLCEFLACAEAAFPPGKVVSYHPLERLLLLELLGRALGDSPYRYMEDHFLRPIGTGHFAPSTTFPAFGARTLQMDLPGVGRLMEYIFSEVPEWVARVFGTSEAGCADIFVRPVPQKDFIPTRFSWGALNFGGALSGQNGVSEHVSIAVRFDEQGENWLAGRFRTKFERDVVLNEICHQLGFSTGPGPVSLAVGSLNGFEPHEITGAYEGGGDKTLHVTHEGASLDLAIASPRPAHLICTLDDEGGLETGVPMPGLWIEPFRHPTSGATCLMFGQTAYIRRGP